MSRTQESPATSVRTSSIRVALVATAVVAAIYVVIGLGVLAIVNANLVGQIDERLTGSLEQIVNDTRPRPGGPEAPPGGPRFGPTLVVWTVSPSGDTQCNVDDAVLPAGYKDVIGPVTTAISGTEMRLVGAARGDEHVVVAQSTASVSDATGNVIRAELLIAPLLLAGVFGGSVVIGRRVAGPIERARARQLEFTANASHELRTPLSVIEAQTGLALAQERDEGWYRSAFEQVGSESRRMRGLVDDLLWLARFDAGASQPDAEPVDLSALAAQAVDRFAGLAESRHLDLRLSAAGGANIVTAPPRWLDQLLGVLIDNAVRYTPSGGTVEVSVRREGRRIGLAIEDSGPGIAPGQRERIFDRFHRATDEADGTGLGLAIADAIVRATRGRWQIGTSVHGGASMAVSWSATFVEARQGTEAGA